MSTCNDCYNYEICRLKDIKNPKDCETIEDLNDIEKICGYFKDKLKIIDLPCKVGDTVYVVFDNYITSARVLAFYIDKMGGMCDLQVKTKDETATGFKTIIDKDNYTFENIFLTKEEAEKALEKLKDEN